MGQLGGLDDWQVPLSPAGAAVLALHANGLQHWSFSKRHPAPDARQLPADERLDGEDDGRGQTFPAQHLGGEEEEDAAHES